MKIPKALPVLVVINVVLLFCLAAKQKPDPLQGVQSIVRARAIELVDDQGRVRASLNVETNGEAVFRLRDARETIRVKIAASQDGSGLVLLDNLTNPGLHALTKNGNTTVTLMNKEGRKHVISPDSRARK
ncbi:MAG TPA: hypothetical protein VEH04_11890 [Verrucomicrobiae bacterium]|nr:hypothetical protein [Verrucomicrobiae bacterium]